MRWLALAVAAAALAGCGAGEEEPARGPAGFVTVVVRPEGDDGTERVRRIECPRADLCPRLARASFKPTPDTVACTEIYGGPATATVEGTVSGRRIDASFSLENGCAITRWERYAWLLGPAPG